MSIFSFIEDAVSGIISQILSQFNFIDDLITAPLKSFVQQVVGGIWKGEGANRFAAEMGQEVIPMLAGLLTGGHNFASGIKKSQDHMFAGFAQATNVANSLFDVFNDIF